MDRLVNGRIAAVIDIGSSYVGMRISQIRGKDIVDLERLSRPVTVGHEVFSEGKLSFETIREISSILDSFITLMNEYKVSHYKVIATTALREAQNHEFVLDQLKIQNGVSVEILEDSHEKSLIYSECIERLKLDKASEGSDTIIAYIGTGTIGMALYRNGGIAFSYNLPIGYVKLYDMFSNIIEETNDINIVLEEYLNEIMGDLKYLVNKAVIDTVVITGNGVDMISELSGLRCSDGLYSVDPDKIYQLYSTVNRMTIEKLETKFDLSSENSRLIYSAVAIYSSILKIVKSKNIVSPKVQLWDSLIRQIFFPRYKTSYENHIRKNAVSCSIALAKYYKSDIKHCEFLKKCAVLIFDKLKKFHGLGPRKRLLLEVACFMHECGYSVNSRNPLTNVFDVVRNVNIYGLSEEDGEIAARIVKFDEDHAPSVDEDIKVRMSNRNRLVISKLTAIMRIADSLDKSHMQKLKDIKIRLFKNEVIISARSDKNVLLEKWAFDGCSDFFTDVFGLRIRLIIRPDKMSI